MEAAKCFRPVVRKAVFDARAEAARIIGDARAEASLLLESATAEARDSAEAVRARALEEADREKAGAAVEAVEIIRRCEERLRPLMVDSVLAVAERVWVDMGEKVEKAEAAAVVAAELCSELRDKGPLRVQVHPDDRARVAELGAEVMSDPSLASGDCVVEAQDGVYDGRASVRARLAVDALASALGGRGRAEGGAHD